jgi:hypothetical protein
VIPSSEAEICSRGRSALDRDGTSLEAASSPERGEIPLEGVPNPRARRNLTRGGERPSSEAKLLPVRHRHPRAKRSSARGWPGCLSSGPRAREFILRVLLGSFAFYFLRR